MKVIIGVRFKKPGKVYFFDPGNLHIATKTKVIVETALGEELGEVVAKKKLLPNTELNTPLRKGLEKGNEVGKKSLNQTKENFIIGKQKVEVLKSRIKSKNNKELKNVINKSDKTIKNGVNKSIKM